MAIGTGLGAYSEKYRDSFIDVGIAESTAVSLAASLARSGFKPFVALYSTFLQRAYDQVLFDVAMDGLPVTFMLDRAGIVGEDGETHQGIYDLSLLSSVPNLTIMSPSTYGELCDMMHYATSTAGTKVIRYPKTGTRLALQTDQNFPHWSKSIVGKDGYIITHGAAMIDECMMATNILRTKGRDFGVINARFISHIDRELLDSIHLPLYVAEDVIRAGSLSEHLLAEGYRVKTFTLPNTYVSFGKPAELRRQYGIDAATIAQRIMQDEA